MARKKHLAQENLMDQAFEITAISRRDLLNEEVGFTRREALAVSDAQMKKIASKMADAFIQQHYWESLRYTASEVVNEK